MCGNMMYFENNIEDKEDQMINKIVHNLQTLNLNKIVRGGLRSRHYNNLRQMVIDVEHIDTTGDIVNNIKLCSRMHEKFRSIESGYHSDYTPDESTLLTLLKGKIERKNKELMRQRNINIQKEIYKKCTELEICIKEAKLPRVNTIIITLIEESKKITQEKDIKDAGLTYTAPFTFYSYMSYTSEQLIHFENEKNTVTEQLSFKILHKLRLLVIAKYGKDLMIDYKTICKVLKYVNETFKENYHIFYKTEVSEKLIETITAVIFGMVKSLSTWVAIKKLFGQVDYDLYIEYDDTFGSKNQRDRDRIYYEITSVPRDMTKYALVIPSFLQIVTSELNPEIPMAEVINN